MPGGNCVYRKLFHSTASRSFLILLRARRNSLPQRTSISCTDSRPIIGPTRSCVSMDCIVFLELLLCTLAHKLVLQAVIKISISALLKDLSAIWEVAHLYPTGTPQKSLITVSRMSSRQKKLSHLLNI